MAFIPNDGDIILDATLTDLGRQRMAKGDGSFNVTKFALSDDEINYGNWDDSKTDQSVIESSPILEAITNNSSTLKSFLVTYPVNNLLYLPVMKLNTTDSPIDTADNGGNGDGMFFVITNEATKDSLIQDSAFPQDGFIDGSPATTGEHAKYIRVDQGIDNIARPPSKSLPADLTETSYEIMMDSRFLSLHTKSRTEVDPSYTDDDNYDYYYVSMSNNESSPSPFVTKNDSEQTSPLEVIEGSRGTTLTFSLGSSLELADSDYFFDLLGGGTVEVPASSGTYYDYIDTSVRVKGMTTGYSITIPVRVIRKQ